MPEPRYRETTPIHVDRRIKQQLKIRSALENRSLREIVNEAVERYLQSLEDHVMGLDDDHGFTSTTDGATDAGRNE